jgi:hypothetical protein
VARSELGLIVDDLKQVKLMVVWHFYANSIFGDEFQLSMSIYRTVFIITKGQRFCLIHSMMFSNGLI